MSKPDCFKKSDIARTILETEFKFNSFIIDLIKVWFYLRNKKSIIGYYEVIKYGRCNQIQ